MPLNALSEDKNNSEDVYDLDVIQSVINHLKNSSHSHASEILRLIKTKPEDIDFGQLRTKLLALYNNRSRSREKYKYLFRNGILEIYEGLDIHDNENLFYDALFSFLLILTKYKPTNNLEDENWICSISLNPIERGNRVLTITGQQYEKNSLETWLQNNKKNPATNVLFSRQEYTYLIKRFNDADDVYPEIPHVQDNSAKHLFLKKSYIITKFILECLLLLPICLIVIFITAYVAYLMSPFLFESGAAGECLLGGLLIGASTVVAGALAIIETGFFLLEKMMRSIYHCFYPLKENSNQHRHIDLSTQHFLSFLKKSNVNFSTPNEQIPKSPSAISSSKNIQGFFKKAKAIAADSVIVRPIETKQDNVTTPHDFFLANVEAQSSRGREAFGGGDPDCIDGLPRPAKNAGP